MLRGIRSAIGNVLKTDDGITGRITDFYFDNHNWVVRYIAVEITGQKKSKYMLISNRDIVGKPDWEKGELKVRLSRKMVENCPDINMNRTVLRGEEKKLGEFFGWPAYWEKAVGYDRVPVPAAVINKGALSRNPDEEAQLLSFMKIMGSFMHAKDGAIGRVEDFIVDARHWSISYMAVRRDVSFFKKTLIIALNWITDMDRESREMTSELSLKQVETVPDCGFTGTISRDYENKLYKHYHMQKYW